MNPGGVCKKRYQREDDEERSPCYHDLCKQTRTATLNGGEHMKEDASVTNRGNTEFAPSNGRAHKRARCYKNEYI